MAKETETIKLFKIFIQGFAVVATLPTLDYATRNKIIQLIEKAESELSIIESDLYRAQIPEDGEPDGPIGVCLECGVNPIYNGIRCNPCDNKILNSEDNDLPF